MSFSSSVKLELLQKKDTARHCVIASLCAVINLCGSYKLSGDKKDDYVMISSENDCIALLAAELIKELTGKKPALSFFEDRPAVIVTEDKAYDILSAAGFTRDAAIIDEEPVDPLITASDCCKRAYLKTAFICCGSVTDPEKNYHFEYVNTDYSHAICLKKLMSSFGIDAKIAERKNHYIVYIKEGEQISDMLNLISAHKALMEYENKRIIKDVRNNVNRIVNCETANLNKVVKSSVRQREAIEFIRQRVGFSYLSPQLEEIARVRLENPNLSLKELGELLEPPVGKSGVNHRLKKICDIAEQLKGEP